MTRLQLFVSLCALASAAGCGSSVDHASAVKVMNSALGGTIAADGQIVKADWTPTGGAVDVTLTNPVGSGSAHVLGTLQHGNGAVSTTLDVTFTKWNDPIAGITLDGALHEAGTFSTVAPLTGDVKLDGALATTGSVAATVDFDLHGSYAPTGFSVSGDVGGNSMNASFSISAP
jgi:hypothetical protein